MGNNEGKTVIIRLEPSSFHDVGAKYIWGGGGILLFIILYQSEIFLQYEM